MNGVKPTYSQLDDGQQSNSSKWQNTLPSLPSFAGPGCVTRSAPGLHLAGGCYVK